MISFTVEVKIIKYTVDAADWELYCSFMSIHFIFHPDSLKQKLKSSVING